MRFILLFLTVLMLAGCTSGRKAYLRGDYDEATLKAINRLRSSPNNKKAQTTLRQAYNQSVIWHQGIIANVAKSANIYKWEEIADHYKQLDRLAAELQTCPACLRIITIPKQFATQHDEARLKAAEVRYESGKKALDRDDSRQSAREAYEHFSIAELYYPNYKNTPQLRAEAKFYATLKVLVKDIPVQSRALSVSAEFFENKVREFLRDGNRNEFVRFYTPQELQALKNTAPDQILSLSFDEFMIGQTHLRDSETEITRDSVQVGSVTVEGVKHPVYNTVKAKLRVFDKRVISTGVLDLRITDARTNTILTQEKLPGTFTWETRWATFNGDERALTADDLKLTRLKDVPPPPPQDLFIAFTQPIFSQITSKLQHFYSRY